MHNPQNTGHNVILLGASNPASAEFALAALDAALRSHGESLPYSNVSRSAAHAALLPEVTPGEFLHAARQAYGQNALRGPIERAIDYGLAGAGSPAHL